MLRETHVFGARIAQDVLLLGDEAVALGAIHAGIGGAFAYPGTPATEIFEYVQQQARDRADLAARWSANEKVAYEAALGMSYIGRRALVSMKHVGLNVAADPFMSSALTGANGGLVLAVADDPGMHSSQNEQDSRVYAQFAQIPIFEPADPQQAYEMTREAFELSERLSVPVLIRLVTRLALCRALVRTSDPVDPTPRPHHGDWHRWALLPSNARGCFQRLLDLQPELSHYSHSSRFNRLDLRGVTRRGVIATGVAVNYFHEVAGQYHEYNLLAIGAYPWPQMLVRRMLDACDEILLLEDGSPFVERELLGLTGIPNKTIQGRLSGDVPLQGELTADIVRDALSRKRQQTRATTNSVELPQRPPKLCGGCPHCDTYRAITDAIGEAGEHYYFSDIGCYSLAALPPYQAIDTCVDMGASIGMAIGAARGGAHPIVATIGDSTFIHSGLPALVEAAHDDLNFTLIILDNALVAMTGGQESFATGDDFVRIAVALGVDPHHVHKIEPRAKSHDEQVELIRREIAHRGLSVIIASRPCIHAKRRASTRAMLEDA
jgi:indolepyruvate ferredoxin oxidoreductase alpha subunit